MKKILFIPLLFLSVLSYGQLDSLNFGTSAYGDAETNRTAWPKIQAVIRLLNNVQMYNINQQELQVLNGILATTAELNRSVGVTAPIQTQLNAKLAKTDTLVMLSKYLRKNSPTITGTATLPATTSIGTVSAAEIGYMDNVTSSVQTQLNGKYTGTSSTIRGLFSNSATGFAYNNGTGVFSLSPGYEIFTTASFGAKIDSSWFNNRYRANQDSTLENAIETFAKPDTNTHKNPITLDYFNEHNGGGADSSVYVTITRLTDSLNVVRDSLAITRARDDAQDIQIASLIALMENAGIYPVDSVHVDTPSGIYTINTDDGTIDAIVNVWPANATDTTGFWTCPDCAGIATLDTVGKQTQPTLTAINNGTATVRYTVTNGGAYGEMEITISNQVNIASIIEDGNTIAWFEHDSLLAETGGSVTSWTDIANGYQLLPYQADGSPGTVDNQPSWTALGGVVFDGIDDVLKYNVAGWTGFGSVYVVTKQIGWTHSETIFCYNGTGAVRVEQGSATPNVRLVHSGGNSDYITNFTLNTIGLLTVEINQSTPLCTLQLNDNTPVQNTNAMAGYVSNGIILGAERSSATAVTGWSNTAIYAIIFRNTIDNAETKAAIKAYLTGKYL